MIENVILDLDGVLTDGKQYISPDGDKMFKAFHSRDIRAIRFLVSRGIYVLIISADDWPGAAHWARRTGAEFAGGVRNKLACVQDRGLVLERTAFVGDDAWDLNLLRAVAHPWCPQDAHSVVRKMPYIQVLDTSGGQGIAAALVDVLIARGYLET